MIEYSINVLESLSKAGFTSYKLRKDKIMGERTIQQLRNGELVSWKTIDTICKLLNCQPGDILVYNDDEKEEG